MSNEFEALQKTGLPIDWATLFYGWMGFVATEQLQDYALAQIGYGPESEFALVSTLAFADDRDFWTIQACLEQLASDTPEAERRAARVWRWVTLLVLVERLEEELEVGIRAGSTAENGYWLDETLTNVWCGLHNFWRNHEFDAVRFPAVNNWGPSPIEAVTRLRLMLAEHRRFLEQEEAELRQGMAVGKLL